jgi:hypothetical protein
MEDFSGGKLAQAIRAKVKYLQRGSYYQFDVLFATLTAV